MQQNQILEKIPGGNVSVLGLGVSNLPLVDFLLARGAHVTVRDKKPMSAIDGADALSARGVRFVTGERYLDGLGGDVIFRSPGIRPDLPEIEAAVSAGACLSSEMELFLSMTPATVIGVTGSDGKTTTTTLIYRLLEAEAARVQSGARVWVGGNIGAPLLPHVEEMTARDYAVVELSSFQLQTMRRSPHRAVITNVTPNHLNWHTDMEEYVSAKANICRHQPIAHLTTNAADPITLELARNSDREVTLFSASRESYDTVVPEYMRGRTRAIYLREGIIFYSDGVTETPVLRREDILIPGIHNVENYMAAIAATRGLVSADVIASLARRFGGVEHRLEFVREFAGVRYYNGSIDSSPTRTAAALNALPGRPIVICGGSDKHISFAPLADVLLARAGGVVLNGETAAAIKAALLAHPAWDGSLALEETPRMQDAVLIARSMAKPGDIVILSPACASFDQFRNFAERGDVFKEIVNGW